MVRILKSSLLLNLFKSIAENSFGIIIFEKCSIGDDCTANDDDDILLFRAEVEVGEEEETTAEDELLLVYYYC